MQTNHPTSDFEGFGLRLSRRPTGRRAAFVLIAVLIIIMLASMVAMSLLFRVRAEQTATLAGATGEQARAAAMSGVEEAIRFAKGAETEVGADEWQDNPRAFRDRLVYDDGAERWYFSVYGAANDETATEPRFGLTDEAGRLNLNHTHEAELEKIPGITAAMAAAVRDYIDPDNAARPEGAEQDYYSGLARPYEIRNGPLDTLDELLLVRGFTPRLLQGEDANMNCRLDPNEDDGEERPPSDNRDGRLDLGLRRYLTVSSYEYDNDRDGAPRTNVNNPLDPLPGVELPAALTNFIAAFRQAKGHVKHVAELLEAQFSVKDSAGRNVALSTGVGPDELPQLLDLFSATDDARVKGLINVNTASAAVLRAIPGIDEPLADSIVATRKGLPSDRRRTIAWLYQEKLVDAARFRQIAPRLTARSYQYSFRVLGYGLPSGRYCVLDVMIDTAGMAPAILAVRDLSRFGLPFPVGVNDTKVVAAPERRRGAEAPVLTGRADGGRRLGRTPIRTPISGRVTNARSRSLVDQLPHG